MPDNTPLIIIKKKVSHSGHHGGAWKVAYADFVTAMMALFIVLWLMNTSKPIQEAISGYFRDPSGSSKKVGSDLAGPKSVAVLTSKEDMEDLKKQIEKAISDVPSFDKFKKHIVMTVTSEGLRIELTEAAGGTFFDSGSAKIKGDSVELISTLAEQIGKLPNKVALEGHTDSVPYGPGSTYTNWELSADRANSARRLMQGHDIRAEQVTQVRGFGDRRLLIPGKPTDPSNRRISIIVLYLPKAGDEGAEKAPTSKLGLGEQLQAPKAGAAATAQPPPAEAAAKKE